MRSWWVYWLLHVAFVVVGLAFFWPVLAVDADPRLPYAALAAVVFVETLVDSVPGIVRWLSNDLIAPTYYLSIGRPWGRTPLDDQKFGGVMLWAIGEVVGLPLLLLVVVQWMRADAREAARIDAVLDRARGGAGRAGRPRLATRTHDYADHLIYMLPWVFGSRSRERAGTPAVSCCGWSSATRTWSSAPSARGTPPAGPSSSCTRAC